MRIHFVANLFRQDALEAAIEAGKWLAKRNIQVAVERETGRVLTDFPIVPNEEFSHADLVVAFGGDGTLIRASHLCSERGTPILGVYYGRFGFVTQCRAPELHMALSEILDGKMAVEPRMMLEASLIRNGKSVTTLHALNEAVLQRSVSARVTTFRVTVDGHLLSSYPADGIMVCTATGSTGYSLSAGGPILDPKVQAMVITALNPHALSARPFVLSPDSEVHLTVSASATDRDSILSVDAQTRMHLLPGDDVCVRRSQRVTNLVTVDKDDFLIKLGERLLWSQSVMGDMH